MRNPGWGCGRGLISLSLEIVSYSKANFVILLPLPLESSLRVEGPGEPTVVLEGCLGLEAGRLMRHWSHTCNLSALEVEVRGGSGPVSAI